MVRGFVEDIAAQPPSSLCADGCTVVILAGGQGVRMSRLGRLVPKAALVAYDRPLLIRLLDQLAEAGFVRVLVSTSAAHFRTISSLVAEGGARRAAEERQRRDTNVVVFENPAHRDGPLEALAVALRRSDTASCLMCFGDMFFFGNPFVPFAAVDAAVADYLSVAEADDPREVASGGLIYRTGREIDAVVEQPQTEPGRASRWSGIALFERTLLEDLQRFIAQTPPGSPEGDLFEFRRRQGRRLLAVPGPDFVNINSTDHLLLAALYAGLEAGGYAPELSAALEAAARCLRTSLMTRI